jgi:hypothetical protein
MLEPNHQAMAVPNTQTHITTHVNLIANAQMLTYLLEL